MTTLRKHRAALILIVAVGTAGIVAAVVAAPGGVPGKPGGGGGGEESAANNLSFPAMFAEDALPSIPNIANPGEYSLSGEYVLFNDGTRAYVQKDPLNNWQAYSAANLVPGVVAALPVDFIDVSDNLESVPWRTTSVVRVEFVPFAFTGPYADAVNPLTGFEMAYVSGLGVDEVWGILTTDSDPPAAFVEDLGVLNVGTLFSETMAMSLTKLNAGAGSIDMAPDPNLYTWVPAAKAWYGAAQTTEVFPMTAEINVKGRLIYGYNWFLKNQNMTAGVLKEGWWRLTFYSTDPTSPLDFTDLTELYDPTAPPVPEGEAEPGSGTYPRVPVVDDVNDITYIDVYIQAKTSGGGGGKGGGGNGGGGGGKGK